MAHINESYQKMAIMEFFDNEGNIYQNGKNIQKEDTDVLLRVDLR